MQALMRHVRDGRQLSSKQLSDALDLANSGLPSDLLFQALRAMVQRSGHEGKEIRAALARLGTRTLDALYQDRWLRAIRQYSIRLASASFMRRNGSAFKIGG
jgi:hypothetical protein